MPGVSRTDMNGYRDFEQGHLRTSSYANGYDPYRRDREDMMYREGGYGRSGRQNGLTDDFGEQNSFEVMRDGSEPSYEVDHLATYTSKSGTTFPEDGLTKLKQMESSTGIWTMRCVLTVERRHVTVIDKANGDELERFQVSQIFEPTAVIKSDRRETYNNLLLFTVIDDPRRKGSSSDMHIFQCVTSAAHEIVDEILSAKGEGAAPRRGAYDKQIPPPPSGPAPEPPYGKFANYKHTQKLPDSRFPESKLGDTRRPDSPKFDEPNYSKSRRNETGRLGESKFGESGQLGVSKFDESRQFVEPKYDVPQKSGRYDEPKFGETRLAESSKYGESKFGESRFGDSRLADTAPHGDARVEENNRFKDDRYGATRDFKVSYRRREELDTGQNEALERDVQLLNNCFDDVEKFVSRLQQAAESYKELERRKYERGHKNKKKTAGDGMLMMRARPPPGDDFLDIFQKFKFAFNLLAKLKAHIHDPNAPELVHFLFTPLSLIYEASRDPIHRGRDLAGDAISPLLVLDAKQLLLNCLTSKELELWQHLGKPWTLSKDDWKGHVTPYNPKFYNGRQPSPQVIDEINQPGPSDRFRDERIRDYVPEKYPPPDEDRYRRDPYTHDFRGDDIRPDSRPDVRPDVRPNVRPASPLTSSYQDEFAPIWNKKPTSMREQIIKPPRTRAEDNYHFNQDLKQMGATIYEVVHERQGKNQKELTVEKGDIVQVLDKSRNWWKLKNFNNETGYAPYTILKEHQHRDDYDNGGGRRLSGDYSSYINGNQQAPPPAPPPMSGANRAPRGDDENSSPSVSPRTRLMPPVLPKPNPVAAAYKNPEHTEELTNELRLRMNTSQDSGSSPRSPRWQRQVVTLTQHSGADDVTEWLTMKGFSRRCTQLLSGYHGVDLFGLQRQELERLLGREEGRHLDSLLTVQKNNAGFMTSSGASELNVILKRRKERVDTRSTDDSMGRLPTFQPETPPDYSPANSDISSVDDYGDAGKTLRYLLERQRKKIQSQQYLNYN